MAKYCPVCGKKLIEREVELKRFNSETGERITFTEQACPSWVEAKIKIFFSDHYNSTYNSVYRREDYYKVGAWQ